MSPIGRIFPFLCVVIINLICHASAAQTPLYTYCPNTTFFPATNTALRSSLYTLLSDLSAAANRSSAPGYQNSIAGTFYGHYLCRGDDDPAICRECVAAAEAELTENCPRGKQAATWYDDCMIKYSNESFFRQEDAGFSLLMWNTENVTNNVMGFNQVLQTTLQKVATEAAGGGATLKFDTEQAKFNDFETVYALGQCTPDLSQSDCYNCLQQSINNLPSGNKQGGRVLYFSCNIRYEIYKFYTTPAKLTPIHIYCQNTTLIDGSNIDTLLSTLSSVANTTSSPLFHNYTIGGGSPNPVYGLYLCRGDVLPTSCRDCVAAASDYLSQNCTRSTQAVVLYELCMIRYSNQSFFGQLNPNLYLTTTKDARLINNDHGFSISQFGVTLGIVIESVRGMAAIKKFSTHNENITTSGYSIYMLGQCIPDLSDDDCYQCLGNCSTYLQNCCTEKQGAGVYFFNCYLRFGLSQFYSTNDTPSILINSTGEGVNPPPSRPMAPKPRDTSTRHIPLIIAGSVIMATILWFFGFTFLCWGLKKNKIKATSSVDLSDIGNAESLQMDFSTIRAATQNFDIDNKLGQGGFGPVYKGTLENGQDVAVKRLSHNSRQGVVEFKTEVLLVAKLQHRNLVKLLGFCVSGKEKLLVYEFLSNSSLDKILFDPTKRMSFNWETRFKVICGIAKGLMYIHEDSRLRVVHRDLKSSNILLDETMNPKISDFGLAKLFGVDQTQAVTDSIVGTYGYMAPEYILMGHYSIKSDVYSFGIIVLEVVSGQRNKYINRPLLEEALLYRAWKFWNEGEALKLMDETLGGNYSREDAIKCIHIGLLCIQESAAKRPNMTSIVSALGGQSIMLPQPSPPNFFNNNNTTSATNTGPSGISLGQGVSIGQTSDITQLYGR